MTTSHFSLLMPYHLFKDGEIELLKSEFNLTVEYHCGCITIEGDQSTESGKAIKACLEQRLLKDNHLESLIKN